MRFLFVTAAGEGATAQARSRPLAHLSVRLTTKRMASLPRTNVRRNDSFSLSPLLPGKGLPGAAPPLSPEDSSVAAAYTTLVRLTAALRCRPGALGWVASRELSSLVSVDEGADIGPSQE